MLTVEYRVNGSLIGWTQIINESTFPDDEDKCRYSYSHRTDADVPLRSTEVIHRRKDGAASLISKVLQDVCRQQKENRRITNGTKTSTT